MLKPGSAAAVLLWENTWAVPFGAAVRRSGGQLVTSSRIPTQAILAAIEADRAAQAQGGLRRRCSGIAGTGRACSAEAATGARTAARTGATGAMTSKTVVAAIACQKPAGSGQSAAMKPRIVSHASSAR